MAPNLSARAESVRMMEWAMADVRRTVEGIAAAFAALVEAVDADELMPDAMHWTPDSEAGSER